MLILSLIVICFLAALSCASACEDVNNSTNYNTMVENSEIINPDVQTHSGDNVNVTNESDDVNVTKKLDYQKKKNKKIVIDISVGNFTSLYNDLSDFNENRYFKDIDGRGHKVIDVNQLNKVHTYNLTRDYKFDKLSDEEFTNGIELWFSKKNKEPFENIIINGNGHYIDGNGLASIFTLRCKNVEICNLTIRNATTINQYHHYESFGNRYPKFVKSSNSYAPIQWFGDNGKLYNCTFINCAGFNGGSVYWSGNNGHIEHNKFINSYARFLGGFAYITGVKNDIENNLVVNCHARLDGDALYVKDLDSNNVKKMIYLKVNDTNSQKKSSFIGPDVVDGSSMPLKHDIYRDSYVSFYNQYIDILPIVYASCFYGIDNFKLDNNVNVSNIFDNSTNTLIISLSRYISPTIEIRKDLKISVDKNDLTSTLENSLFSTGMLNIFKHLTIDNLKDYKNAINYKDSSLKSEYKKLIPKLDGLDDNILLNEEELYVLDVKFNKALTLTSHLTWTPKEGFDVININGANSHIKITNKEGAEKSFVDWSGDTVLTLSNLKVSGFNQAFKNIGGQMFLNNVEIFGNKMDYLINRDYGAGIVNTGVVYCANCTFHDNKAKYGGAIYNQGMLILTNNTFYSNQGYSKGDDIVNVDKGVIIVDGNSYAAADTQYLDNVVYIKSFDSKWQTVIKVVCYGGSFVLGLAAGFLTANPLIGMAVGAGIGAAVGSIGTAVICSNVYDINFNRWSCALSLILGSAGAGATGGQIGGTIGAIYKTAAAKSLLVDEAKNSLLKIQSTASANAGEVSQITLTKVKFIAMHANRVIEGTAANYMATGNPYIAAIANVQKNIMGLAETMSLGTVTSAGKSAISMMMAESIKLIPILHCIAAGSTTIATISLLSCNAILGLGAISAIVTDGVINPAFYVAKDVGDLYSTNSKSDILSINLIDSVQSGSSEGIKIVNDLTNIEFNKETDKCPFTADEISNAISSIDLDFTRQVGSILY